MEQQIYDIVMSTLVDFNEGLEQKAPVEKGPDTPLYGENGTFDSLQLVSFIVSVEQALAEKLGKPIALADEKALSMSRSPFQTVGTLVQYASKVA